VSFQIVEANYLFPFLLSDQSAVQCLGFGQDDFKDKGYNIELHIIIEFKNSRG